MRILVTAGNTFAPIDRVRGITNIFTGRTGAQIALNAEVFGHDVTLLTSHPRAEPDAEGLRNVHTFVTFDEFATQLEAEVRDGAYDAIVHAAAVSDYQVDSVYLKDHQQVNTSGKIKSDVPELWLKLVRAPKLIDRFRADWKFNGVLVKFKLEVGVEEPELLKIAEASRQQSRANLMVANSLEGAKDWAYIGPFGGQYERVTRAELPKRLLSAISEAHSG
jgi:phosphopantothenate-cysteine ligase/phosphopantothenoylcysteine decarboxylase/phosphopantothenate--cysteine ligase